MSPRRGSQAKKKKAPPRTTTQSRLLSATPHLNRDASVAHATAGSVPGQQVDKQVAGTTVLLSNHHAPEPQVVQPITTTATMNNVFAQSEDAIDVSPLTLETAIVSAAEQEKWKTNNAEKEVISTTSEPPKPTLRSAVWKLCCFIDFARTRFLLAKAIETNSCVVAQRMHNMIAELKHEHYVVCKICFENKECSIKDALISCSAQNKSGMAAHNIKQHYENKVRSSQECHHCCIQMFL